MLRIESTERHRHCDGVSRRTFLGAGVLGTTGLGLPDLLRAQARARDAGQSLPGKSVILVWLDGGPTHLDTYDPKPDAPAEYRGPLGSIPTSVPGLRLGELLPRQAALAHRLSVVRSLHHSTGDHFAAAHWMLTGSFGATAARLDPQSPSAGSVVARVRGPNQRGVPAYVAVPRAASVGLVPGYNGAAYLGSAYNPFQCGGDPNSARFQVKNLTLPGGMSLEQLEERTALLGRFDTMRRDVDRSGVLASLDQFQREAYELITGPRARAAFDLSDEDPRLRDRYGRHTWGQSCLLARRLVEQGVSFVTVHMGGWDDHAAIERAMRLKLPILDAALASLIEDLAERGLLDRVAVCVCGEFGRTPRVNGNAGRDHWGQAGFALLAGGGLNAGLAVGATTARGEYPARNAVLPADLLATLYHLLGIDPRRTFEDSTGRPRPILDHGRPIEELL